MKYVYFEIFNTCQIFPPPGDGDDECTTPHNEEGECVPLRQWTHHEPDTGLSLVKSEHVTQMLTSYWSVRTYHLT